MSIALDLIMSGAADNIASGGEKLKQNGIRIGLGMWPDRLHDLSRKAVVGGGVHHRPLGRDCGRGERDNFALRLLPRSL